MVLSASTNQGGDDMMSAARGPAAMPSASAAASRARAPSSVSSRTSAEAAWAWPPPPRAAITAATSKAAVRLRPTANTRPSISTSITIAGLSVRSVILEARVDTPSTYRGQRAAATSTATPPSSSCSDASIRVVRSARWSASSGVCRKPPISSWFAPWRTQNASASTSRTVVEA